MPQELPYILRKPAVETKNPKLLLMLHGYGSDEKDLFSFASYLPDELFIVSVRAPLNLPWGGYAWYTINLNASNEKFTDVPEAIQARESIRKFIKDLNDEYKFDLPNSFLLGFSQGAILSYALALSYPDLIPNVLALSGYINQDLLIKEANTKDWKKLDFFRSHGNQDMVLPVELAYKTTKFLNKNRIKNIYKEYPMGHGVSQENFQDILEWLTQKLR